MQYDHSFLYNIPLKGTGESAIIWESVELEKSKATHIFRCPRKLTDGIIEDIQDFLMEGHVRHKFHSSKAEDVEKQKQLYYVDHVRHSNFDLNQWVNDLYQTLPELPRLGFDLEDDKNIEKLQEDFKARWIKSMNHEKGD